MIYYTIFYKKVENKIWKKIKNVKGDGLLENNLSRFFILEDEAK